MKSEIKCGDDQNCLSKEERKQKKEERRKKKRERLDKQNSTDVEQLCEDAGQNTSQDLDTESRKKNRKRKKHNSDSVGDEIVSEIKPGEHCINEDGKIKRQKTENIGQSTNNNCDSSSREVVSKKKKRKKEKTIFTNPACDTNELSCDNQDISQSVKTKIKKHKKTKAELADDEYVMPAKIDSNVLDISSGIIHEKSKKRKRMPLSTDEKNEDEKDTDSKENNSSTTEEKSSKNKKKQKKHSKHKDCESIDETDSNICKKKHKSKRKKKSTSDDEGQESTKEHDSVETQDIVKHVSIDVKISQTGDGKSSKHHKKQKKHPNNSTTVTPDKNFNGNQESCSEITEFDKPASDKIIKAESSPVCAAAALGNWQGNLFENNERQNKFLRLLGGMKKSNSTAEMNKDSATLTGTKKKGLFGSLATLTNTASSAALDVNAAASLIQRLEDEYNRAMDFKLSGKVGTGFGFVRNPAEGKKFHIDVNKSKSVKFE